MSNTACRINGCVLTEHGAMAPGIHEGRKVSSETWEVRPSLVEGEPWEVDAYAPANRDMTTAEARTFAAEIMRQADLVDELNKEAI